MNATTPKQAPRPGATIIPGFNGRGQIDLKEFSKLKPKIYKKATFIEYSWVDLQNIDTEDLNFHNVGVRSEMGKNEERIETMKLSFRDNGFMTTEFPPTFDTNNVIIGGRTRIAAAIANGERYMPIAVYSRSDTSIKNTITNGLIENYHIPSDRASFPDFVAAGIRLVTAGDLTRTIADIDSWLFKECNIAQVYDNSVNGTVTRIRDKILEKTKLGNSLVLKRERKDWEKWIVDKIGLKKEEFELVSIDSESYPERLWTRKVLSNKENGQHIPVRVIFYTNADTEIDAKKNLKQCMRIMADHVEGTYGLIELMHGTSFAEKKVPYNILGAVPQIINSHPVTGNKLVPIEKY